MELLRGETCRNFQLANLLKSSGSRIKLQGELGFTETGWICISCCDFCKFLEGRFYWMYIWILIQLWKLFFFFTWRWFIWRRETGWCDGRVWWWRQGEDFSPQHPTPASRLPDSLWVFHLSSRGFSPSFWLVLPNCKNMSITVFTHGAIGGEAPPTLLSSSGTNKKSSTLEQAPISDRSCDRLNTLNALTNSQTGQKRRPGKTSKCYLTFKDL